MSDHSGPTSTSLTEDLIADVRVYCVSFQHQTEAFRRHTAPMGYCFVRVSTRGGVVGWGEACDSFGCSYPPVVAATVEHALTPCLLGENVGDVRRLVRKMRAATRRRLGDQWSVIHSISAVELALWDALGKIRGLSVSAMTGQFRSRVDVYASGNFLEAATAEEHVAHVRPFLSAGVTAAKFRMGPDHRSDLEKLAVVRDELGPDIDLMIDGSENYSVPTALHIAEQLHDLGVGWFEEPLPQHHRRGIEEVVRRSPVPIAYGEHLFTTSDVSEALVNRQANILQPDAASSGGISECLLIAALAENFGVKVVPHFAAGPVALAANLHLTSSIGGAHLMEYAYPLADLWDAVAPGFDLTVDHIRVGALEVPSRPGLGVDLDEDVLADLPYQGPQRVTEVSRRSMGVL